MDSTRISLARVIELGIRLNWREAAAILHEALILTGPTKGARPSRVGAESCVITRGGEVTLIGAAARARPETIVRLLEDLLPACDSPGGLGAAYEHGTAIAFLEELSQRTTPKRRRVEIASVAIRAISAEADRAREADEAAEQAAPMADFIPALPAAITPAIPDPEPAPPPAPSHVTPFVPPHPTLKAVPPPVHEPHEATVHEFDRLRAEMAEREQDRSRFDLQALLARLREVDAKKLAAAAVPIVLIVAWWLWPAAVPGLPPTPKQYDPIALAAIPLSPGWADVDRIGGVAANRARAAAAAAAVSSARPPVSANLTARNTEAAPPIVAEPRADASVALVPPAGTVPSAANPPSGSAPSAPPPAIAASVPRTPTPAPTPAAAAATAGGVETVYSWTSSDVEPPVIRSPAMPSWATPPPSATIDGPYLEVLVDQQGQVETVRVRGRIEPGETFYRHRMMLASAKLWQFAPARLNGQPVRYVVRVLLDQP
jgi:hypothetical protein